MKPTDEPSHYLHGTSAVEQERLARLNELINDKSLRELALRPGESVLDVGSGLGQMTRAMARQVGAKVVGIERSEAQLAGAIRLASEAGEVHWSISARATQPACHLQPMNGARSTSLTLASSSNTFAIRSPSFVGWFVQFDQAGG